MGHLREFDPSKLETKTSRVLLSSEQMRSLLMKTHARAFSPRFSRVQRAVLRFLSKVRRTNWPPSMSKFRMKSWLP